MKSKVPLYDALNIQMRGYDYVVLENYQRLLHSLIKNMDIDVEDSWAVPAQELQIITYKPNSEILDSKYFLKNYERTIQVTDLSALQVRKCSIDIQNYMSLAVADFAEGNRCQCT